MGSSTELSAMELEFRGLHLLDSPWSVLFAQGTRGRRALEIYNNGLLLDVMVESTLATHLLRGARRGERDGVRSVLAWGHVPADGEVPQVGFGRGGGRGGGGGGRGGPEAVATAGGFWLALASPCAADHVAATGADGAVERLRVRAGWSR